MSAFMTGMVAFLSGVNEQLNDLLMFSLAYWNTIVLKTVIISILSKHVNLGRRYFLPWLKCQSIFSYCSIIYFSWLTRLRLILSKVILVDSKIIFTSPLPETHIHWLMIQFINEFHTKNSTPLIWSISQ